MKDPTSKGSHSAVLEEGHHLSHSKREEGFKRTWGIETHQSSESG